MRENFIYQVSVTIVIVSVNMGQHLSRIKSKAPKSGPEAEPERKDETMPEPEIEIEQQPDPAPRVETESIEPKEIVKHEAEPELNADTNTEAKNIPFLCPIKDHQDYYRPLLMSSEIIQTQCDFDFIVPLLLKFVCGELDHSMDFFRSPTWKQIKHAFATVSCCKFILNFEQNDPSSLHKTMYFK